MVLLGDDCEYVEKLKTGVISTVRLRAIWSNGLLNHGAFIDRISCQTGDIAHCPTKRLSQLWKDGVPTTITKSDEHPQWFIGRLAWKLFFRSPFPRRFAEFGIHAAYAELLSASGLLAQSATVSGNLATQVTVQCSCIGYHLAHWKKYAHSHCLQIKFTSSSNFTLASLV